MANHPLVIFLTSNAVTTLSAAYTDRGSPLRYVAIVALAGCAYLMPRALDTFSSSTGWLGRVIGGAAAWSVINVFDRLILRGWDYHNYRLHELDSKKHDGKRQVTASSDVVKTRMDFGSEVSGEARGAGRFWEVKNVPYFSRTNPKYVPSRGLFIVTQALTVVACYLVHNWAAAKMLALDRHLLDAGHIPLLRRLSEVSYRELETRTLATFCFWASQCCLLNFFYCAAALVSGVFQPQDIERWRPFFGSPIDAYTIRNAWGKSWHQLLRSGLEGTSGFIVHDVLRLPRSGLMQRYGKILFSFSISGLMHVFADMGGGVSVQQSGSMQFFCVQAVGIMIEDTVQAVYRRVLGSTALQVSLFNRILGYVWVASFAIWTSPVWIYPTILTTQRDDSMLSLTAITPIIFGRKKN